MSDETPQDPTPETPAVSETPAAPETPVAATPPTEPPAETVPTEETPVAAAPVAAEPVAPVAPVAAAPVAAAPVTPAPAPAERKVVAVPMSVLIALGAIIVAALMFGIGYAVGDSNGDDTGAVNTQPQFQLPGLNDNGNNGNGNQQIPTRPQTPNPSTNAAFLGVATEQTNSGLQITQVVEGSAADDVGLAVDDVITEFDGDDVTTSAQLAGAVAEHDAGDRVEITYTRDGQEQTVTVTLGTRAQSN